MFSFLSPENLFFLIILAVFARICFYNLKYGVYIIIFLMPSYLWRTEIFSIPTTLLELMIYVLFLTWAVGKILTFSKNPPNPLLQRGKLSHPLLQRGKLSDSLLQRGKFHNSQFTIHNSKLILGIVLLFLGLTISTAISTDIKTSAGIFKGWFVDPFLFFLVLINVIKTKKQIINLFSAWMLSGVAVAMISIFYLMVGDLTYDDRLKAFFLSPNYLAMYLAPAFLIILFFLLDRKEYELKKLEIGNWKLEIPLLGGARGGLFPLWKRGLGGFFRIGYWILDIAILIIILVPLYFTFSYGAFLGIAAAIFYFISSLLPRPVSGGGGWGWVKSTRGKPSPNPSQEGNNSNFSSQNGARQEGNNLSLTSPKRGVVNNFIAAILCFFVFYSLLFLSVNKFQQITDSQNRSSFHSRLMIWNASKEILKDNFIFGIGPGTFQEVYLSYADKFDKPYLEWAVPQPHNIFLAFWLQTGLLGLAGFILILIWFFNTAQIPLTPFYKGGNSQPLTPPKRGIHNSQFTIPITLMIYFLVHGLTDTTYWKNDLSLMFWILIGIMAIIKSGDFD